MLLGGLLLLTACEKENPLLHSEVGKRITHEYVLKQKHALDAKPCHDIFCKAVEKSTLSQQLAIKTKNNLQCPYYFADPNQHEDLKSVCEPWMQNGVLTSIESWWKRYAIENGIKPETITDLDVKDPAFWQEITNAMDHVKKNEGK